MFSSIPHCLYFQEGGVGFDYRLQMAIADKWIEVRGGGAGVKSNDVPPGYRSNWIQRGDSDLGPQRCLSPPGPLVHCLPCSPVLIPQQVLKSKNDYEWDMSEIVHTLTNR